MYGPPGRAYVYLVYGMYDCLNVVTEPAGRPAAVLVRAVEPLVGLDAMREARLAVAAGRLRSVGRDPELEALRLARLPSARLASGPGLVAAAFGLVRSATGMDLCDPASPVRLEQAPAGDGDAPIVATPRVGVGYAGSPWSEVPWRLALAGHPSVSGPRARA
jgi:DNA-3-methyladenine glycosylase